MPPNKSKLLFELANVFFKYPSALPNSTDRYAISDLTLNISAGEYVAVAGSNGSGKSTFAKLLTGLVAPTSGDVQLAGRPLHFVQADGQLASHVGIVFQNPDLQSVATIVEEDVAFVLENLQTQYEEMHQRVERALRTVGMWAYRQREVHHLSGGQRQRVAIAGVLAADPACIVFDEVTSMLDAVGRREIRQEMKRLAMAGHTVISITHHVDEMADADRLLVFDHGACAFDGRPSDAFFDARVQSIVRELPASILAASIFRDHGLSVQNQLSVTRAADRIRALGVQCGDNTPTTATDIHSSSAFHVDDGAVKDKMRDPKRLNVQNPVVDIAELSHIYSTGMPTQTRALHNVSFRVFPGEIVGIMGATGSGKSTLGLYLNGLYRTKRGVVQVFGMDAAQRKHAMELRRRVGMLFQKSEDQIFESLIGDEIAYGPFRFGATVAEARESVRLAMDEVGLDFSLRDRPTRWLSGGERRRVALASVLAQQPDMLVLDEPTLGLDPSARKALLDQLLRLRRDSRLTILFVTHHVEEVASIADRVLVMRDGRLVLDEAPLDYFANTASTQQVGFELPDIAQYAERLCEALHLPLPHPLPFTADAFKSWFEVILPQGASGGSRDGQL